MLVFGGLGFWGCPLVFSSSENALSKALTHLVK